jgi:hypothetical protein
MFQVNFGEFEILCQDDGLPVMHQEYAQRAILAERYDLTDLGGSSVCFSAVRRRGESWPSLVVTQQYSPAGFGFNPGVRWCLRMANEVLRGR